MEKQAMEKQAITAMRVLTAEAIQKAKSGHPGYGAGLCRTCAGNRTDYGWRESQQVDAGNSRGRAALRNAEAVVDVLQHCDKALPRRQ